QYEKQRLATPAQGRARTVSPYTVANELSTLRHLLRLAKRWGYVSVVPEITLPKKPEGRLRFLDVDELRRLLDACRASRNPCLRDVQEILGHADLGMTQRYAHLSPAPLRGAVERLEGLTGAPGDRTVNPREELKPIKVRG